VKLQPAVASAPLYILATLYACTTIVMNRSYVFLLKSTKDGKVTIFGSFALNSLAYCVAKKQS
jgi:hypothetical protein